MVQLTREQRTIIIKNFTKLVFAFADTFPGKQPSAKSNPLMGKFAFYFPRGKNV